MNLEHWEEKIEIARAIKYRLYKGERKRPCMWCGSMLEFEDATIEHLLPASQGGPLALDNAGVACGSCNQKRGTRTAEQFLGSAWLLEKRRQVNAQKSNRRVPTHADGFPMDEEEIRLAAFIYLRSLTNNDLAAMLMGMAKPGHLDRWAKEFVEINQ